MAVKMNSTIITKNHAADPEREFLAKSVSMSNGSATVMPTAWEVRPINLTQRFIESLIFTVFYSVYPK